MIVRCEVCKKKLTDKQITRKSKTCSIKCRNILRKKMGWWYKTPLFAKAKRGALTRTQNRTRKHPRKYVDVYSEEDVGSHGMSWHGIYNKKQVAQMKGEGVEK